MKSEILKKIQVFKKLLVVIGRTALVTDKDFDTWGSGPAGLITH